MAYSSVKRLRLLIEAQDALKVAQARLDAEPTNEAHRLMVAIHKAEIAKRSLQLFGGRKWTHLMTTQAHN